MLSCAAAGSAPATCEIKNGDVARRDGAGVLGSGDVAPFGVRPAATTKDLGTAFASAPSPDPARTPSIVVEGEPSHETTNTLVEAERPGAQQYADSMQGIDHHRRREKEGDVSADTSVPCKGPGNRPTLPECVEPGQEQRPSGPSALTPDLSSSEQPMTGACPVSNETERSPQRSKAPDVTKGEPDVTVAGGEADVSSSAVAETLSPETRNEKVSKEDGEGSARCPGAVLDTLDITTEAEIQGKKATVEKEITSLQEAAEPSGHQSSREARTHDGGLSEDTGVQSRALLHSTEACDGASSAEGKKRCAAAEVEEGSPPGGPLVCVEREVEQSLCTETERLNCLPPVGGKERGEEVTRNLSPSPRQKESRPLDTAWANDGKGVLSGSSPDSSGVSQPPKESVQLVESAAEVTEFPDSESLSCAAEAAPSRGAFISPSQLLDTPDGPLESGAPPFPESSSDFETALVPVGPALLPVASDISVQHGLGTAELLNSPRRADQLPSPRSAASPGPEGRVSSDQSHGQGEASVSLENGESEFAAITSRTLSLTRPRTVPSPLAGAWVLGKKLDSGEVDETSGGQGDFLAQAECLDKTGTERCRPINAPDSASTTVSSKSEQYAAEGATPTVGGHTKSDTENTGADTSTHELERDGHPPAYGVPSAFCKKPRAVQQGGQHG